MRAKVTRNEVRRAAGQLVAEGHYPSAAAVHALLRGEGSTATIQKYLDELSAEIGGKVAEFLPPLVPRSVIMAAVAVWAESSRERDDQLEALLAPAQQERETLVAELESVKSVLAAREDGLEAMSRSVETARQSLAAAQAKEESLLSQVRVLEERYDQAIKNHTAELTARSEHQSRIEARFERDALAMRAQIESTSEELRVASQREREHRNALDALTQRYMEDQAKWTSRFEELTNTLAQAREALASEKLKALSRIESLMQATRTDAGNIPRRSRTLPKRGR